MASIVITDRKWVKQKKLKFADIEPNWHNPITAALKMPITDSADTTDNYELTQFSEIDSDDSS